MSLDPGSAVRPAWALLALAALLSACASSRVTAPADDPTWTTTGPVCDPEAPLSFRPADGETMKDFALVHDGTRFHVFAMRVDGGWQAGGETRLAHASSPDLVEWTEHDDLDLRRPDVAPDHVWAPHVVHDGTRWWMFYTGVVRPEAVEDNTQRLVAATSPDLFEWNATDVVVEGDSTFTRWGEGLPWGNDLRDAALWPSPDGTWTLFATVRLDDGRQAIATARSDDLATWSWDGAVDVTAGDVAESPSITRTGDGLWLFWTAADGVRVARAEAVDGPWIPAPLDVKGFASEAIGLVDDSLLFARIRAGRILFSRLVPDAGGPPAVSAAVSPLCADGPVLVPGPTVLVAPDALP